MPPTAAAYSLADGLTTGRWSGCGRRPGERFRTKRCGFARRIDGALPDLAVVQDRHERQPPPGLLLGVERTGLRRVPEVLGEEHVPLARIEHGNLLFS